MNQDPLNLRVRAITWEAEGVLGLELVPLVPGGELPVVQAGAHVDLLLPGGQVRSYSLVNPGEAHRWCVAVNRDAASRGGSRWVHESLDAYEAATAALPREQVHLERFANTQEAASAGGFTVVLARSGQRVPVKAGETVLDALLAAGHQPSYSCRSGVCGTCETRVLRGTPDHRDLVLGDAEKAACDRMMICCSGALTPELELDL